MYKFFIGLLAISFCVACNDASQSNANTSNTETAEFNKHLAAHYDAVYQDAYEKKDYSTMVYAINGLLKVDSSKNNLMDTLLYIYYQARNSVAVSVTADKILKSKPNDTNTLLMGVEADQTIGRHSEAELKYAKIYALTKDLRYEYYRALNYYLNDEIEKGDAKMNEVINNPESYNIIIPVPNERKNNVEPARLVAAAYYQRAMLLLELGRKNEAIASLQKSSDLDVKFSAPNEALLNLKFGK